MKKTTTRFLSTFLAIVMLCSCVNVAAFATAADNASSAEQTSAQQEPVQGLPQKTEQEPANEPVQGTPQEPVNELEPEPTPEPQDITLYFDVSWYNLAVGGAP